MMISNVKYLQDKDNNQKKLIKELTNEKISKIEEEMNTHIIRPPHLYDLVLYAKYLIEKENLDIKKIVDGNIEDLETLLNNRFEVFGKFYSKDSYSYYGLNEALKKIIFDDYEISTYMDRVLDNYINPDKKYLLISTHDIDHIKYSNVDIFLEIHPMKIERKKLIDEILGINRTYYRSLVDVNVREYDEIIYLNDGRDYKYIFDYISSRIFGSNSFLSKVRSLMDIFMVCKYADISTYDDIICIESILLDKDKTYIKYKSNGGFDRSSEMIIKELSNIDDSKINEVIKSDIEKKDVCIHITRDEFRKHNYRIGISTYKTELSEDKAKIIKLIDYNKSITNRLRVLDDEISKQIDEMIVR